MRLGMDSVRRLGGAAGRRARLRATRARLLGRAAYGQLTARAARGPLRETATRRWWTAYPHRPPLAVAVVLASSGAVLVPGTGALPPDGAAPKRISGTLSVLGQPAASGGRRPRHGAARYYRRIIRKHVPAPTAAHFLELHRIAGRQYGVDWRLLASIHRQETAFSTASTTYHGLNAFGCCAGPMQFNVTNGPVSTWKRYRNAYRAARRPARYPHRTRHHPSIYDDFDAITAAASLLSDAGAGTALDGSAWWAAYSYYGHDLFGVTYANEVLARAVAWQRDGFCANCALDIGLVDRFERAYGRPVRRQLRAAERREKHRKRHKKARHHKRAKHEKRKHHREKRGDRSAPKGDRRREPAPERPADPPQEQSTTPVQPPAADPPPEPAPAVAPAPPPPCTPVRKLLGRCPP